MNKDWLDKNRRAIIGMVIFAVLIGANLIVHLRRRPAAGPETPAGTVDPPAAFPTVSPASFPSVSPATGTVVPRAEPVPTPIPGGAMSDQFALIARSLEGMESAFAQLEEVITIPSASEPFLAPGRNIFRWQALPAASATVPASSTAGVATEPVVVAQPVVLGQFSRKDRGYLLLSTGDRTVLLPEGEFFPGESYTYLGVASGEVVLRDDQGYSLTLPQADLIEPSVREAMDTLTGPPRPLTLSAAGTASGTSPPP